MSMQVCSEDHFARGELVKLDMVIFFFIFFKNFGKEKKEKGKLSFINLN